MRRIPQIPEVVFIRTLTFEVTYLLVLQSNQSSDSLRSIRSYSRSIHESIRQQLNQHPGCSDVHRYRRISLPLAHSATMDACTMAAIHAVLVPVRVQYSRNYLNCNHTVYRVIIYQHTMRTSSHRRRAFFIYERRQVPLLYDASFAHGAGQLWSSPAGRPLGCAMWTLGRRWLESASGSSVRSNCGRPGSSRTAGVA